MAYLYVSTECLADDCESCPGRENTPPRAERIEDQRFGGGICAHACHGKFSPRVSAEALSWYADKEQ